MYYKQNKNYNNCTKMLKTLKYTKKYEFFYKLLIGNRFLGTRENQEFQTFRNFGNSDK